MPGRARSAQKERRDGWPWRAKSLCCSAPATGITASAAGITASAAGITASAAGITASAAGFTADRRARNVWRTALRVIASSLRKGNIVEIDDKLYVILAAENIHPGKGTPVTQVDMRRISDGVKVSQRYKTTEQVERAHVEDREFQFLYSDGDGSHFMNMESYDQITVPTDVVGDQAAYLQ